MTDLVADFLTRIRNADMAKYRSLEAPASEIKRDIAEILKHEGFVRGVKYIEDGEQGVIHVLPKFGKNGERVITNLKRISKPGLHAYVRADETPKVLNGLGIAIISASEGVVTGKKAREENISGEVIAYT